MIPLREPVYLKWYDIEKFDGRGHAEWTKDITQAMRFPDRAAAMLAWNMQSKVKPLRDDGKPNKPLTAFTVELIEVARR
jgi:hypothetical protein